MEELKDLIDSHDLGLAVFSTDQFHNGPAVVIQMLNLQTDAIIEQASARDFSQALKILASKVEHKGF